MKRFQFTQDLFAFHREKADFGFDGEPLLLRAASHLLVRPDDVLQVKGNLLLRLVFNDIRDLFRFHRRQLDESGQPVLTRHRYRHLIATD